MLKGMWSDVSKARQKNPRKPSKHDKSLGFNVPLMLIHQHIGVLAACEFEELHNLWSK